LSFVRSDEGGGVSEDEEELEEEELDEEEVKVVSIPALPMAGVGSGSTVDILI
jgi:hypothetical protein